MIRIFAGYWKRETPARSAPPYEHQLQQNATIWGSKSDCSILLNSDLTTFNASVLLKKSINRHKNLYTSKVKQFSSFVGT